MLSTLLLIIPAVLWGCTNPFIRKLSAGVENIKGKNFLHKTLLEIKFIFTNFYVSPYKPMFKT